MNKAGGMDKGRGGTAQRTGREGGGGGGGAYVSNRNIEYSFFHATGGRRQMASWQCAPTLRQRTSLRAQLEVGRTGGGHQGTRGDNFGVKEGGERISGVVEGCLRRGAK